MIYWNPDPDLVIIPIIHWPIKWYGLLFALGFAIGFPLFKDVLLRYFLQHPEFEKSEILGDVDLRKLVLYRQKACSSIAKDKITPLDKEALRSRCSDPDAAVARLCWEEKLGDAVVSLKKKALKVTDKITIYMIVATILGARLGHFLFYEKPSDYLRDPMEILRIREGGLASHGAAMAILLALWLFTRWSRKQDPGLTWLRLLDFIAIPTALTAGFIRLGNFVNQEILGTPTNLPWGVLFGHPADGSFPVPRHPVQLYESLFYFVVFFILWRFSFNPKRLLSQGWLIGLFLILVFVFRFFVEFVKEEESHLLDASLHITMGQWLSIPFVLLGAFLLYYSRRAAR
jgi:prolipoprotein diacylglyceryl transferase